MTITEPTVVYRGLDFATVEHLTDYLRENGVHARVSVPDPQCAQVIPMFETHHEILATNFDAENVRELIEKWKAGARGGSLPQSRETDLYCYHCGESLASDLPICPACKATLD
ncbi:hypothetical protein [Aporhodopirellula aestuarii]|uniref:DUF2007 domain-containing protein n=1 Tax=Aporhodopirellula aestuarii TaxID=2950107 RepID=A0ABT0UF23_9BACT|nr:hypothetical protein [Aporhodopirellula aestuarii]MCM2375219.1 hypothetical protein [Aporhodopirellula aestuarii]